MFRTPVSSFVNAIASWVVTDGVSPTVAKVIEALDRERMALLTALGYPAQSDPRTSVQQGYAESEDYFACYKTGSTFVGFASPDTLDNRYFHEDIGVGLVMFCSLGKLLGVPTPASEAVVRMGSVMQGVDYMARAARTVSTVGLEGLSTEEIRTFLEAGR